VQSCDLGGHVSSVIAAMEDSGLCASTSERLSLIWQGASDAAHFISLLDDALDRGVLDMSDGGCRDTAESVSGHCTLDTT
jgi:hypothetical protein